MQTKKLIDKITNVISLGLFFEDDATLVLKFILNSSLLAFDQAESSVKNDTTDLGMKNDSLTLNTLLWIVDPGSNGVISQ